MRSARKERAKIVAYKKSGSDWWRQFLELSPDGYREVLKILQDRYTDEMRHAQLYAQHAR